MYYRSCLKRDEMNWSGAASSASYIITDKKKSSKGKTVDLLLVCIS